MRRRSSRADKLGIPPTLPRVAHVKQAADRQPDGEKVMAQRSDRMETIVSLSKRRGIVYPSSEIYGGLRAAWDYGPLGVEIKNNIKRQWWRSMVDARDDMVGVDSRGLLAPEAWRSSVASPTL